MEYQHYQYTMNSINIMDNLVYQSTLHFINAVDQYMKERQQTLDTLTIAQRVHERRKRSS